MALYLADDGVTPVSTHSMIKTFRMCPREAQERFWSYVDKTDDCWLWLKSLTAYGYGQMRCPLRGRPIVAHKLAWELTEGPVPPGMVLDHICQVRRCVRPSHLRVCTRAENLQYREPRQRKLPRNVSKHPQPGRTKPYHVRVVAFGQVYYGGQYFASVEEAEERAIQLRQEIHKEFFS